MKRVLLTVALLLASIASLSEAWARPYDRLYAEGFESLDRAVRVSPSSVILTDANSSVSLTAEVLDSHGSVIAAPVTWVSSDPAVVSVNAAGQITSHVDLGSAIISAESPGAPPTPVLVAVATPVDSAILLTDDEIVGDPAPLDEPSAYGPNFQYEVVLAAGPPPAPGAILINTGEKPVAGQVVSVDDSGSDPVVTLALLPLSDLFDALEIREQVNVGQIAQIEVDADFAGYDLHRSTTGNIVLSPPDGAAKAIVPVGECTTPALSELFQFDFEQQGDALYVTPDLDLVFEYTDANGLERLELVGSVQTVLDVNIAIQAQVEAEVRCQIDIVTLVIPFSGPLGLILSPRIPLGVGFDLGGKVTDSLLRHNMLLSARLEMSGGIACNPDCEGIGNVSASSQYVDRTFVEDDTGASADPTIGVFQVEVAAFAYAFANLALGPIIPALDIEFELIAAKGGNEQKIDLRSTQAQVDDPAYAAGFDLSTKWTLALGSSIQGLLDLLSINQLGDFKLEYQDTLAMSPGGTVGFQDSQQNPTTSIEVGELMTVSVDVAPTHFLGLPSVVGVDLYRRVDNGSGGFDLVPNRPGCASINASNPNQTTFSCQTFYDTEHIGTQTLVAFIRAKLFGVEIPIPLEASANSAAALQVTNPDDPTDPNPVLSSGAGAEACVDVYTDDEDLVERCSETLSDSGGTVSENGSASGASGQATASASVGGLSVNTSASSTQGDVYANAYGCAGFRIENANIATRQLTVSPSPQLSGSGASRFSVTVRGCVSDSQAKGCSEEVDGTIEFGKAAGGGVEVTYADGIFKDYGGGSLNVNAGAGRDFALQVCAGSDAPGGSSASGSVSASGS